MSRHLRAWLKRVGVLHYGSPSLELQAAGRRMLEDVRADLIASRRRVVLAGLQDGGRHRGELDEWTATIVNLARRGVPTSGFVEPSRARCALERHAGDAAACPAHHPATYWPHHAYPRFDD